MKKQKITLLVILLLIMNLFLEITFAHGDLMTTTSEKIAISQMTTNHHQAEQNQDHNGHDHCSNGVCHSGFCKLVNSFVNSTPSFPFYSEQYSNIQFIIPDSPYLMSNRRPPKSNT